jgi:hypothetical protein
MGKVGKLLKCSDFLNCKKMQSQPKYFHGIFSMSGLMSLLFGMFFLFLLSTGLNAQDQSAIFSSTGRSVMVIPTITGPASVCEGVAGYVYSTEAGMTGYVWTVSAGGTVTSGAGTNSITVTWGSAGTETVTVTYVTASVPALLSVTVSPFSNAAVSISASSNPVCAGVSVSFTAIPLNGGSSPNYQWKVNGFNVGSSSNTFSYIPSNGDVVTCQLTSNLLCVTGNPASATPITMAVTPNLAASVFITASANPV